MSDNVDIGYNAAQRKILLERQSNFFHQKEGAFVSARALKQREKSEDFSYRKELRQRCVARLYQLKIDIVADFHGFFLSVCYLDMILGIEEKCLPPLIKGSLKKDGNDHLMMILLAVIFKAGTAISCDHNDGIPAILPLLGHYEKNEILVWKSMEIEFYNAIQWRLGIPTIVDFIYADRQWDLSDRKDSALFMTAVTIAIKSVHVIDITSIYYPSLIASACILVADGKLKEKKVGELSMTHMDYTEDESQIRHIRECIRDVLWVNTDAPIADCLRDFLLTEIALFSGTRLNNVTNEINKCPVKKAPKKIILNRRPSNVSNTMDICIIKRSQKRIIEDDDKLMYFHNKKGKLVL